MEAEIPNALAVPPRPFFLLRRLASACLMPLIKQAAGAYVAGETLADAFGVVKALAGTGASSTIGYFNEDDESPQHVSDEYQALVAALAGSNNYLSIKWPALGFSSRLLGDLATAAAAADVRLHFDAMWIASVTQTITAVDELVSSGRAPRLGFTLPGRWLRSLDDAAWVCQHKFNVRVVKGQWADPAAPHLDMSAGFLQVIDQLAGRAASVAVATHDVELAESAIRRLQHAGTTCELELLHGLPMRQSLLLARQFAVPVRVYVPYGRAHLPYAIGKILESPHLAWWLFKDLVMSALGK